MPIMILTSDFQNNCRILVVSSDHNSDVEHSAPRYHRHQKEGLFPHPETVLQSHNGGAFPEESAVTRRVVATPPDMSSCSGSEGYQGSQGSGLRYWMQAIDRLLPSLFFVTASYTYTCY